jgi:hypothetical protein
VLRGHQEAATYQLQHLHHQGHLHRLLEKRPITYPSLAEAVVQALAQTLGLILAGLADLEAARLLFCLTSPRHSLLLSGLADLAEATSARRAVVPEAHRRSVKL